MSGWEQFVFVVAGVVTAVVLPVIADKVRKYYPQTGAVFSLKQPPEWLVRYFWLAVFSVLVAGLIFAGWKKQNPSANLEWYSALLLGFTSESAIEKVLRPKVQTKL